MKRTLWHTDKLDRDSAGSLEEALAQPQTERVQVDDPADANLISSLTEDGLHAPVLDLDLPHTYVPSSTPGHGHLYLDVEIPWDQYVALLAVLHDAGIIQTGFFYWSLRRQATFVRTPDVSKEHS